MLCCFDWIINKITDMFLRLYFNFIHYSFHLWTGLHWILVHFLHRYMVAALHSYTHSTWLKCWGSGSLVESTWCYYVMVEADSHPRLLPAFILDIYKVFEHVDMLSMGIQYQPYTVIHPTWLIFWGFWSLMESKCCQYIMVETNSHLKLLPASMLDIYKVFEQIYMLSMGMQ